MKCIHADKVILNSIVPNTTWMIMSPLQKDKFNRNCVQVTCTKCGNEKLHPVTLLFGSIQQCSCLRVETGRKTTLAKYGVDCILKHKSVRDACSKVQLENKDEIHAKRTQTLQQRFGVDNYAQTKIHRNRLSELHTSLLMDDKTFKELAAQYNVSVSRSRQIVKTYGEAAFHIWAKGLQENGASINEMLFKQAVPYAERFDRYLPEHGIHKKPDFKLNDKIYVECDGLYIHSEKGKTGRNYHVDRRMEFEKAGLRLIFFRSDEIEFKPIIIKSMCDVLTGKVTNKIAARKCTIKSVPKPDANKFLLENHLMGTDSPVSKGIGLYFKDELVCLLTYKKTPNKPELEISRFCTKHNSIVIAGFSRLIRVLESKCLECHYEQILTWVDLRYGTGNSLLDLGFKLIDRGDGRAGYSYTDGRRTTNRLACRAIDGKSERQVAAEKGLYRIYDAGQRKYVKFLGQGKVDRK